MPDKKPTQLSQLIERERASRSVEKSRGERAEKEQAKKEAQDSLQAVTAVLEVVWARRGPPTWDLDLRLMRWRLSFDPTPFLPKGGVRVKLGRAGVQKQADYYEDSCDISVYTASGKSAREQGPHGNISLRIDRRHEASPYRGEGLLAHYQNDYIKLGNAVSITKAVQSICWGQGDTSALIRELFLEAMGVLNRESKDKKTALVAGLRRTIHRLEDDKKTLEAELLLIPSPLEALAAAGRKK